MATATYSVTTSATDLKELWRKVQAGVVVATQFGVEEWNLVQDLKEFDVDWSAREITFELDITDDINVASIPEGGKEARPASPTVVDANFTWILLNKRFTISLTAQYISQKMPRAMLENQLKYQSKKAVQAIRRKVGDNFYGFSTGVLAIVNGAPSSDVFTLDSMYGVAGIGDAGENRVVTDLFRVGEYVWVLNPTGPAIRGTQPEQIIAITPATPSITLAATPASSADDDLIVAAGNLENTTLASGSEYNRQLVGLLDQLTSTSVHGVSSATQSRWAAGYTNTTAGRFTGIKLRKMKQGINNNGGGKLTDVLWANGVENDVVAQLQAGLRFTDSFDMEMDGRPKSKGVNFVTTRRVPDGFVFGFDRASSIRKGTLLPEPGNQSFRDGHKLQDDSGLVFSLDYPAFLVTQNRGNMAYESNKSQQ
jgi:hypothetical protein